MSRDVRADRRTRAELLADMDELRARLDEAVETLRAIRSGEIDALVVAGAEGERIFTLEGAEHAYRVIVETMGEGAVTATPGGTLLFANQSFARMVRLPLEHITGHALGDFVAPDHRGSFAEMLAEARMGPTRKRIVLTAGDGGLVPAYVSTGLLRDQAGFNVCLVVTDLSELEAAAKRLERVETRLHSVVDSAPVVLWTLDAEGTVTLLEGRGLAGTGVHAEDTVGRSAFDLIPDRPDVVEHMRRALAGEDVAATFDVGDGMFFDVRSAPLKSDSGRVVGVIGVAVDVTDRVAAENARRKSEENYRRIVETANEGIWTIDADDRVTFANRKMAEMLGYAVEELVGRRVYDFMYEHVGSEARARLHDARYRAGEGGQFDMTYRRRDGGELRASVSRTPILDESGRYIGGLAMVTDVSARRRLELEVLTAGDEERRRIGQDLHDTLGQSLAGITLLTHLLAEKLAAKSLAEAAEAEKIAAIAKEAAGTSRTLARRLWSVEIEPGGLAEALGRLAGETTELFGIKCTFTSDTAIELQDRTVAGQAYLIALEAVNNAVKHSGAGEIVIRLERKGSRAVLSVRDNGRGIPDDLSGRKGLGIRSMRYRAGVIGGGIDIRRAPGGGTVVVCELPASARRG